MSGCGMIQVNEEKDRKIVIAEVNDEKVLKGKLLDLYRANYGETEEYNKEAMSGILDSLIEEELVKQKAKAAGHVVNDEVKKQAKEDYDENIEEYAKTLKERAEKEKDPDPDVDYMQLAKEEMTAYLTSIGSTEDEYLQNMAGYIAIQNYLDEQTADQKVEDSEVEKYYQDELTFQKESPSMAAYYSVAVPIVTEAASRRVKHILIKLSDEDAAAIDALRKEKKTEEADTLRKEKLETIRSKAESVLADVKADGDFEALLIKHGEDPGMKLDEYKDGYTMARDEGMMPEFLEASFKLKEGEVSDLVATDVGYHIIKVYEAKEDTIAPLEDVKEDIQAVLLNQKKSKKTDELVEGWLEEANVKKYENRL